MNMEPIEPLGIVWHTTPENVFYAMWEAACLAEGITAAEFPATTVIGVSSPGGENEAMTVEQVVDSIRDMGMWGFVDTETRTIHAWADPATAPGDVLHMLAHEAGHVTGEPLDDEEAEELRADAFGAVAAEAYRLLSTRPKGCGECYTCRPVRMTDMKSIRMVLCQTCGNKRCPRANSCANACTGSNAPGQPGSAY